MDTTRRHALKTGSGVTLLTLLAAAGWLRAGDAAAEDWNKAAFETKSMDETMKALGGGTPTPSSDIAFFSTPCCRSASRPRFSVRPHERLRRECRRALMSRRPAS